MHPPLGSKDNPFSNVNEAFESLLKLEKDAFDNDNVLQSLRHATVFGNVAAHVTESLSTPFAAYQADHLPAGSFIVNRQQSGRYAFKPVLTGRKFLFRGQTQDYPRCVPTLFRDENQDYFINEMILNHEMYCLIETHPLVQLLGIQGIKIAGRDFRMATNYFGICQHYFNRTVFLDLTSDVDTAKFFATSDFKGDDCKPHEAGGLGVIYWHEIEMPYAFQRNSHNVRGKALETHLSTIGKQVFPRSGRQFGYLLEMEKDLDFFDLPTSHKVFFRHDAEVARKIFETAQEGRKYMPASILDQYWKEKMSSPRTDRLISQNALAINLELNKQKETKTSLQNKLERRGFTITRHAARFTPDQLHSYYQDIKNGWWDEFLSDIHFLGPNAEAYKEELRQIELNPAYAFAFHESAASQFHYQFDLARMMS